MYRVIRTNTCRAEVSKWPPHHRRTEKKLHVQLARNPKSGTACGLPFLREKCIREKRIYYLVYDDLALVLLVATSGKKDRQDTIDHIKKYFVEYRKVAEMIAKRLAQNDLPLDPQDFPRTDG